MTESEPRYMDAFGWYVVHNVQKFDREHNNSREKFKTEFKEFKSEVNCALG